MFVQRSLPRPEMIPSTLWRQVRRAHVCLLSALIEPAWKTQNETTTSCGQERIRLFQMCICRPGRDFYDHLIACPGNAVQAPANKTGRPPSPADLPTILRHIPGITLAPTCSHQTEPLSARVFLRSQCSSLWRVILQERARRWKSSCPKVRSKEKFDQTLRQRSFSLKICCYCNGMSKGTHISLWALLRHQVPDIWLQNQQWICGFNYASPRKQVLRTLVAHKVLQSCLEHMLSRLPRRIRSGGKGFGGKCVLRGETSSTSHASELLSLVQRTFGGTPIKEDSASQCAFGYAFLWSLFLSKRTPSAKGMGPSVCTAELQPCCLVSWRMSPTTSGAEALSWKAVKYDAF